jgi:VWFA-related protein
MRPFQIAVSGIFLAAAVVQTSAQAPQQAPDAEGPLIGRFTTTNILAPVLVTDRSGNIIDGLQPHEFHLFDNQKQQNIQVDVAFEPISLVVLIEKATRVEAILPQIKHLGAVLPLVVGDHGEAAVLAFDSRLQVMQDFTQDPDKVKASIDKINAGNSGARMIDAVDQAVAMLKKRPANNRKIILLVSETRDSGSEGRVRETLIDAQLANVLVYTVDITQLVVRLTEKPTPPRPNPIDVTAGAPLPMGQVGTPTTDAQSYGPGLAQFGPLLTEIYKDAKGIFINNPSEVFTKGTGGEEYFFIKQKGLEDAVQRISQEIRSQYLISYNPNNSGDPGFHSIAVTLDNPRYVAKTRPGYWIGGGAKQ